MAAHVKVSGTWQELTEIHVKVGGTWQEIQEGWVKVAGTWEQFHTAVTVSLSVTGTLIADTDGSGPITGTLSASRGGVANWTSTDLKEGSGTISGWATPTSTDVGDDYEVRVTINSGDSPTGGSTTGSWLALTSDRSWSWTTSDVAGLNANVTMEFRKSGDATVLATDTFDTSTHVNVGV